MAFDFRKLVQPARLGEIDPRMATPEGMDLTQTQFQDAPGAVRFQPGLGEAPPEQYEPSWLDKALYAVSHAQGNRPSMYDAERAMKANHTADLFAKDQRGRLDDAGVGMNARDLFALNQDPGGFAQSVNKQYDPREISPGASFNTTPGGPMQIAPQNGVTSHGVGYQQGPDGIKETGRVAVPMTDAETERAAIEARLAGIKELIAPSQVSLNASRGRAALTNANRPRGVGRPSGGQGVGAQPKATGKVY